MNSSSPTSSKELDNNLPYAKPYLDDGNAGVARQPTSCLTFSRGWLQHIAQETCDIASKGYYTNQKGHTVSIKDDLDYALNNSEHYHGSYDFSSPTTTPASTSATEPDKTQFIIAYGSSLQVAEQLCVQQGNNNGDNGGSGEGSSSSSSSSSSQKEDEQQQQTDQQQHVGILNSASGKTPAKFLRGTISQEECICRASLLYPCLQQYEDRPHYFYYVNHRDKYINNASACLIFAPNVPVVRKDSVRGELLDRYYKASFVSIPSANAFHIGGDRYDEDRDHVPDTIPLAQVPGSIDAGIPYEHQTLSESMYDRIYRAISVFYLKGCTQLVLCAFGCGAHGNNPQTVAKIFRRILIDGNDDDDGGDSDDNNDKQQQTTKHFRDHFETVVFAIQPSRTANYDAFKTVFPEAACV